MVLQPPPRSLLYLLLRHSMLLEYAAAGSRLLIRRGLLQPAQRREPELVDIPLGTLTVWRQLMTKISVQGVAEPMELGKYMLGLAHRRTRRESRTRSQTAERIPRQPGAPEYARMWTGSKSCWPARLISARTGCDAWITSFATKRLAEMRKANPTGVLFGGYGWVMNLKPAAALTPVPSVPGIEGPIFQSATNPGFVHTPSLTQAATVAVLRSGHLTHAGNGNPNNLFAIDLSSERVRLATWLLDGVRQGQPLGALLGYRFERRIQEATKPQFIASFRELARLAARKLETTSEPVESIAANNVVDGLALLRRWQKGKSVTPPQWNKDTIPFGEPIGQQSVRLPRFDPNNPEYKAIQDGLEDLENAVDAVSDALMAESVYQIVRGNPIRAASTVESIAGGETPPPELDVVTDAAHRYRSRRIG